MNEQYIDWKGSRWEGTKATSTWHFNPQRPPEPGKDSFTRVCRFNYDFTDAIARCTPGARATGWADRNKHKVPGELYTASAEEADLIRAGADPKMEIYDRKNVNTIGAFNLIRDLLGLAKADVNFHNQRTGQMLVTHIDNFPGNPIRENSFKVTKFDERPEVYRRFAIMLADWQLGQVFQLGNAMWTQWRAGDCITWEWRDIPHATCNMGWWDRPMLQVTGNVTQTTLDLLAKASPDLIIDL